MLIEPKRRWSRDKTYRSTARDERAVLAEIDQHRQQRQGDEIACSCGRRWPVGENHP